MIFRQASRCSTLINFFNGAVSDTNSSILPTSDQPISVVLVSSGCKAKRIRGTDRAVPTTTDPKPSSTPRKERRVKDSPTASLGIGDELVSTACNVEKKRLVNQAGS